MYVIFKMKNLYYIHKNKVRMLHVWNIVFKTKEKNNTNQAPHKKKINTRYKNQTLYSTQTKLPVTNSEN